MWLALFLIAVLAQLAHVAWLARPMHFAKVIERHSGARVPERAPWKDRWCVAFIYSTYIGRLIAASPFYKRYIVWSTKRMNKLNDPQSARNIESFLLDYDIDPEDIEKPIRLYKTLNEFFARYPRRPRLICEPDNDRIAIVPCDCRLSVFNKVSDAKRLLIKGTQFSIDRLLDNAELAQSFRDCQVANCRLAPHDIHHYYTPVSGTVSYISTAGKWMLDLRRMAHSSPINVQTESVRKVIVIDSPEFGKVAFVVIGGAMVASINLVIEQGQKLRKGQEIGYFLYGGSNVTVLFQSQRVAFDADLLAYSSEGYELKSRLGDRLGAMGVRPM